MNIFFDRINNHNQYFTKRNIFYQKKMFMYKLVNKNQKTVNLSKMSNEFLIIEELD